MANEQVKQAQRQLRKIGWPLTVDGQMGPNTREAIRDFQRGFAFWKLPLRQTGKLTTRTRKALAFSVERGGACSKHFKFHEFKSKGNGWIRANRHHVKSMEKYRAKAGPTFLVSAYRDPAHNVRVGGATFSQHTDIEVGGKKYLGGNACDVPVVLTFNQVLALKRFSGIGISRSRGKVVHVDSRHAGGYNATGGSPSNPTTWFYP